jgi:hypothetical protein
MDIKVKATGKIFHQMPPDLSAILLEMGLVERVEKPAPAPKEPQWTVGRIKNERGVDAAHIVLTLPSGEVRHYDGPPDKAADGFKYRQWSGQQQAHVIDGPEPPVTVIEQYRAIYKEHAFTDDGSMMTYWKVRRQKNEEPKFGLPEKRF